MTIPNIITFVRLLVLTPAFVILAAKDLTGAAVVTLVVLGISDWADGFIARRFNQVSELGKAIDPLADRAGMAAVILTLAITGRTEWWMLGLVVVPDVILAVGMLVLVVTRRWPLPELSVTWLGKARTAALMVGLPLLLLASSDEGSVLWDVAFVISTLGCVGHAVAAADYARQAALALRARGVRAAGGAAAG